MQMDSRASVREPAIELELVEKKPKRKSSPDFFKMLVAFSSLAYRGSDKGSLPSRPGSLRKRRGRHPSSPVYKQRQ